MTPRYKSNDYLLNNRSDGTNSINFYSGQYSGANPLAKHENSFTKSDVVSRQSQPGEPKMDGNQLHVNIKNSDHDENQGMRRLSAILHSTQDYSETPRHDD